MLSNYSHPWWAGHDDYYDSQKNCLLYVVDRPANDSWDEWDCVFKGSCMCQYDVIPLLESMVINIHNANVWLERVKINSRISNIAMLC